MFLYNTVQNSKWQRCRVFYAQSCWFSFVFQFPLIRRRFMLNRVAKKVFYAQSCCSHFYYLKLNFFYTLIITIKKINKNMYYL